MDLPIIISLVATCVTVATLGISAYRERREGSARAEQRAKAIIDLLRIAENEAEPRAVREFARQELHRMRAKLVANDSHESLVDRVFGNKPVDAANAQLVALPEDETEGEPLDPDTERLMSVVRWWTTGPPITKEDDTRLRIWFVLALQIMGFLALAVGAVRATLFSPFG